MSELKDYDIMDIEAMDDERLEKSESGKIQATRVYIKSEADKVIAEKDKEIRRQKYKRCLDKASYWVAVSYQCVDDKHHQNAVRHCRKWLELANKFKEQK